MPNCTTSDVRLIISTGLEDTALATLIALADEEMAARKLQQALLGIRAARRLGLGEEGADVSGREDQAGPCPGC